MLKNYKKVFKNAKKDIENEKEIKHSRKNDSKNSFTELVFILDKSGSMEGLESDTVGGFNSMIEKQRKTDSPTYVSTVLFSNNSHVLHDRVKLTEISTMKRDDFVVGGCTALLDAIGDAIHHIGNIHKYSRPEDVPANTIFVIMTDGMENASHKYSSDEIKHKIKRQQDKFGWEFLFLGANIDAVETAKGFGIYEDRAVNYNADCQGTQIAYEAVACAVESVRTGNNIEACWSATVDEDYRNRR